MSSDYRSNEYFEVKDDNGHVVSRVGTEGQAEFTIKRLTTLE
jgi:hypothetical protein